MPQLVSLRFLSFPLGFFPLISSSNNSIEQICNLFKRACFHIRYHCCFTPRFCPYRFDSLPFSVIKFTSVITALQSHTWGEPHRVGARNCIWRRPDIHWGVTLSIGFSRLFWSSSQSIPNYMSCLSNYEMIFGRIFNGSASPLAASCECRSCSRNGKW